MQISISSSSETGQLFPELPCLEAEAYQDCRDNILPWSSEDESSSQSEQGTAALQTFLQELIEDSTPTTTPSPPPASSRSSKKKKLKVGRVKLKFAKARACIVLFRLATCVLDAACQLGCSVGQMEQLEGGQLVRLLLLEEGKEPSCGEVVHLKELRGRCQGVAADGVLKEEEEKKMESTEWKTEEEGSSTTWPTTMVMTSQQPTTTTTNSSTSAATSPPLTTKHFRGGGGGGGGNVDHSFDLNFRPQSFDHSFFYNFDHSFDSSFDDHNFFYNLFFFVSARFKHKRER
ncbi:hypothetical protein TYRP_003962 [Tyrophagus putrescentiae]|nr:hypothetical protein TYRP_003962 [Tyrophagus putrescentiae]